MPNPRAQQQLAQVSSSPLDRAVHELKSLSQPAQALGDMLASTLRGSTAATIGFPGDVMELVRVFGPEAVGKMLGDRVLPTTEEMKGMMPKATSYENPYESIGELLPLPGTGTAIKAAGYGAGRGAGALTRAAGQAVSDAMINQAGPLASGPLSALAPRMAMTNVVKPKGGNWETNAVEKAMTPMMTRGMIKNTYYPYGPEFDAAAVKRIEELKQEATKPNYQGGALKVAEHLEQDLQNPRRAKEAALNKWIQGNLTNYIKKEMGTPEDPIRRLAEEGITHFPAEELRREADWLPERLEVARKKAGFPAEGMAKSPEAQGWEIKTDTAIEPTDVGALRGLSHLMKRDMTEPWMAKVPDETKVYMANDDMHGSYLGFDHILDVLRQDLDAGRIRPEQLNKVSMEQAVRRVYEYDQEMARKMAEAQLKQQEGFPIHKDYGDEGYKWIELAPPKELPSGYSVVKDNTTNSFKVVDSSGKEAVDRPANRLGHINVPFHKTEEEAIAEALKYDKRLEEALKYEGDTMGHCVGGYCPDVLEGRSRIFSLRDKKGEPHVTVEVSPSGVRDYDQAVNALPDDALYAHGQLSKKLLKENPSWNYGDADRVAYEQLHGKLPERIAQIKGKQNKAPKEDYLPYVQDFVRGGEWSDIGDFHNTGLAKLQENSDLAKWIKEKNIELPKYPTKQELNKHEADFLLEQLGPEKFDEMGMGFLNPEEGMKAGGKVSISDNPDRMWMEVQDQKFAGGGVTKLAKLMRAPAKTKAEIEAIAERMAPQVLGEYVRASEKSAKTVAGKTQKQFAREKELQHDIRPTDAERPLPKEVNIEDLKNSIMMGISGDPTITGHTLHAVGGRELRSPSPQHGGPLYGLGHDKEHFWASNLGAAQGVQNRARELSELYDSPVIGNYVMMGPDSYSYAQHFADANLQNIRPEEMTKAQIEGFNKLIRQGSLKSGPRPTFPGIENPDEAYLHMAVDPELRKHFGNLMQMPTVTERFGLPSGLDVAHAVTEPSLRDLEIGVTGKSMGRMRPEAKDLKLSEHPTYSHDIPGEFMGGLRFPVPYELSFPDTLKAVRENPAQAPQEFGSFKMVGPRQVIDQQLIDEIRAYEERMRQLTGKKAGGAVMMSKGGEMSQVALDNLAKLKELRDKIAPVANAWTAKQAEDSNKYTPDIQQFKLPIGKAAGGEISADDLILEERPL